MSFGKPRWSIALQKALNLPEGCRKFRAFRRGMHNSVVPLSVNALLFVLELFVEHRITSFCPIRARDDDGLRPVCAQLSSLAEVPYIRLASHYDKSTLIGALRAIMRLFGDRPSTAYFRRVAASDKNPGFNGGSCAGVNADGQVFGTLLNESYLDSIPPQQTIAQITRGLKG